MHAWAVVFFLSLKINKLALLPFFYNYDASCFSNHRFKKKEKKKYFSRIICQRNNNNTNFLIYKVIFQIFFWIQKSFLLSLNLLLCWRKLTTQLVVFVCVFFFNQEEGKVNYQDENLLFYRVTTPISICSVFLQSFFFSLSPIAFLPLKKSLQQTKQPEKNDTVI